MKRRITIAIVFLIIGLIVYYLFHYDYLIRDNTLLIIVRNYIPDICWIISFFFISINFSKNIVKRYIVLNSCFVIIIAILFEIMQKNNLIKGTFDYYDIGVYVLSIIISILIELRIRSEDYEKNL